MTDHQVLKATCILLWIFFVMSCWLYFRASESEEKLPRALCSALLVVSLMLTSYLTGIRP